MERRPRLGSLRLLAKLTWLNQLGNIPPTQTLSTVFSVFGLLLTLSISTACAANDIEIQRKLYLSLENRVANQPQLLTEHIDTLSGYPLLPYLQSKVIDARLHRIDPLEIAAFLTEHDNAPFAETLRTQWLKALYQRKPDTEFLHHYKKTRDLSLHCRYLGVAGKKSALRESALRDFNQWWHSGEPIPEECQSIEKTWQEFGGKRADHVWARIEKTIEKGNASAASQLKAALPSGERQIVDIWLRVRDTPTLVTSDKIFDDRHFKTAPAVKAKIHAYGLERLAWRDRDTALQAYQKLATDPEFPDALRQRVQTTYAIALASAGHPAATGFLAALSNSMVDERVEAWRIVDAMRRLSWSDTDYWLSQLRGDSKEAARWRYFSGKSASAQGKNMAAMSIWQPLSSELNYYGFLARAQLGQQSKIAAPTLIVVPETLAQMRELPAVKRAKELLAIHRVVPARREWQALLDRLDQSQTQAVAMIAHEWGWNDRTIFSLARAPTPGAWELRFPTEYADRLGSETDRHDLDTTWAFAITRQESAFMSDAKSPAGALGLMQLMPETARLTAKKHRIRFNGTHDLISPQQNIKIGVAHLADLIEKNEGNFVYATAAYNAGQGRVNRWKTQFGELPLDIWIETIPYSETQQYVKNVMAFSYIYADRLDKPTSVFDYLSKQIGIVPTAQGQAINTTP